MNMSILIFEVELSNSTIEPFQPDDPVTFFTLFSIIAVVVIISFSILIGVISCPQNVTGNLLGLNCLSNVCGGPECDDEKEAIHCRNDSVMTFVPAVPVTSVVDSASRGTGLSSSSSSIDTIKTFGSEDERKATFVHIYDVIPEGKSRRQDGNYNSVQTKLKVPKQLPSLDKSDHYQTPSPVTCRLQCCHGNTEPAVKKYLPKTRQGHDVIDNATHTRPVDPVQPKLDQNKCQPNRRDCLYNMKARENEIQYSNILHSERNRITRPIDDIMAMECRKVHIPPDSHPHGTLDMSGQFEPVNSLSPIRGDKVFLKDSTQPRLPTGYQTVLPMSDEINHFSQRLHSPRFACRSPCFSRCNEFLPPSFYQNVSSPQSKGRNILLHTPEAIPFTGEQYQGQQKCIPPCNENMHSPQLGFSYSVSSSDHVIHDGDQTLNVFQHNCDNCSIPSKVSSHLFHKGNESNSSRDEMSTFDFEPSTQYDTSKDSITLSSQPRTSTLDRIRHPFSFQTRYDALSDQTGHLSSSQTIHLPSDQISPLPCDQISPLRSIQTRQKLSGKTIHLPSSQTRHTLSGSTMHAVTRCQTAHASSGQTSHLPSGQTSHLPSGQTSHLPSGQTSHLPSSQTRHTLSGSTMHAVTGCQTAHASSGQTRHSTSGHNRHALSCITKSALTPQGEHGVKRRHGADTLQNKPQFYSDDVTGHQLGRDAVAQTQELNQMLGRRTEHGQRHPVINHRDLERPTVRQGLGHSMIGQPSNGPTRLSAKESYTIQDVSIRLSQPDFTETSTCCQKNAQQKSHTQKITENQRTKSKNNCDFLFDGILPFKDTCRRGQGHNPESEELRQHDRQNHSSVCSNCSDYVIMNNPYVSMTSSDIIADFPRPRFLSTGTSQTKSASGQAETVLGSVSTLQGFRDMTSPYRFHTPADAIHSLKSYIRRNF